MDIIDDPEFQALEIEHSFHESKMKIVKFTGNLLKLRDIEDPTRFNDIDVPPGTEFWRYGTAGFITTYLPLNTIVSSPYVHDRVLSIDNPKDVIVKSLENGSIILTRKDGMRFIHFKTRDGFMYTATFFYQQPTQLTLGNPKIQTSRHVLSEYQERSTDARMNLNFLLN